MNTVVLLLGGNVDDTIAIIAKAEALLDTVLGKKVKQSSLYRTEPWGFQHQNWFINKAIVYETNFTAQQILERCLQIEHDLGRTRSVENGYQARTIDIDILFYNNDSVTSPTLTIPHPRIQDRRFVLVPLFEIMPEYVHPVLQKAIATLLQDCNDCGKCERIIF